MSKPTGHTFKAHVTPRSGRDIVMGRRDSGLGYDEVCVRVKAAPADGAANKAVCKTIAASLGVPKSTVSIAGGLTSRRKVVEVGCSAEDLEAWLLALPRLQR